MGGYKISPISAAAPENIPSLNIAKFLLILGVVLIHCNPFPLPNLQENEVIDNAGLQIVMFLSSRLCSVSVPCFFIISGFLFFRGIEKFDVHIWFHKLKSRSRTLIVPYFLWNLIGCVLALVKSRWLGFPSYGVIVEDHINIIRLVEGFVDLQDGFPYAFAFWFMRNLILFVVISPLTFFFARKKWIFALFIVTIGLTDTYLFGFEYFTLGAFLEMHYPNIVKTPSKYIALYGLIVWVFLSMIALLFHLSHSLEALNLSCTAGAFVTVLWLSKRIASRSIPVWFELLVRSTFFIYAIHQFFCTIIRNFYITIFGVSTFPGIVISYIFSFLTLISISFLCWVVLKKYFPRLTVILGGDRGKLVIET